MANKSRRLSWVSWEVSHLATPSFLPILGLYGFSADLFSSPAFLWKWVSNCYISSSHVVKNRSHIPPAGLSMSPWTFCLLVGVLIGKNLTGSSRLRWPHFIQSSVARRGKPLGWHSSSRNWVGAVLSVCRCLSDRRGDAGSEMEMVWLRKVIMK